MGIEQRLDLLSPLQSLMKQIGDSMKEALPTDAKVKIELETTPLQEVEASIQRTKENAPESASTKLSGAGDPFAKTASAQEELDKAMGRIEAIAGRIGYLLQKIEGGKDATGNAAQEVERLRDSLEKVANKGREAAKSLGDEGLASKINEAEKAAAGGHGGRGDGSGGASPGDLMNMVRNPMGAMQQGFQKMLQEMLGGEGGAGIMRFLGPVAAVAGGVYAGWKINDNLTKEATSDAQKAVSDAMLANTTGRKFDFRGELFDKDRFGPIHATRDMQDVSNPEVRSVLRGMGIGLDTWKANMGGTQGQSVVETAMLQARYAYGMGVSTDQVAGMVGAGVRTGAVGADELSVRMYLSQIAGATQQAAAQGVATNEKLSVIASLNQRTVSETGMLSPVASKLNLQASAALEATGDPALKGQLGMGALGTLAGTGGDEARSREIGLMMGPDGNLLPEYQKMVDANPYLKALQRDLGPAMVANALLDDPTVRAAVNQRGIRNMVAGGATPLLAGRLLGVGSGSMSKDAVGVYGAGLGANDILSQTLTDKLTPIDKNTAQGKELSDALGAMWSGQQRSEVRQTGYEFEAAKNLNEAAAKLNAAADHLGRWLSDGTFAQGLTATTPGANLWMNRGF